MLVLGAGSCSGSETRLASWRALRRRTLRPSAAAFAANATASGSFVVSVSVWSIQSSWSVAPAAVAPPSKQRRTFALSCSRYRLSGDRTMNRPAARDGMMFAASPPCVMIPWIRESLRMT